MIGSNASPDINSLQWRTILSIKESIIQNEKYIRMFNPSGALAHANEYGTGINLAGLTFTPDTKAASVNGYQYQDTQGYLLDKNGSRISLEWAAPLQNGGALAGEYFDFIEHKSTYSGLLVPTSSNGTPLRNTSYFNYELFQRHYKENTFLGLEKIHGGYLYNDGKGFYYLDNRFGDDVTMAYNENSSWFKASVDLAQIVANTGKAASPDARKAFYDFAVTSYSPGENANYINGTCGTMPYCYNGHGGFVCNPGITGIQKLLAMTISGPFSQLSTLVNIGDLDDQNTIIGALIYSLSNLGFLTSSSIKMPESYTLIDTTKLMSAISTWGNELGVKFVAQTGTDSPLFKIINTLKPAIEALPTQLDLITKTAFIVSNFGVGGTFYPRVTFGIGLVVKF